MRANPFESQLERLARTLTEQFGVQVVCQGDNAWTDGRQIVLPSLPEPMEEGLERMMVGYLDHEMAHVAFSDFGVAGEFEAKHPGCLGLLNVVEDALIERRAMDRWPGVRANLDAMFRQIRPRVKQLIAQRGPFDRFCTAIYLKLAHYRDLLGLDRELVGFEDLLDRFSQLHDTRDAAELSEALLARWRSRHPSRPGTQGQAPQSASGKGQPQGQSSPGGGSGKGRQEEGESDGLTGSSPGSCDHESSPDSAGGGSQQESCPSGECVPQTGSQTDATSPAAGGQASTPSAEDAATAMSIPGSGAGGLGVRGATLIGEALAEAIRSTVAQVRGDKQYRVFTKQHDRIAVVPEASPAEVSVLLERGGDTVRRLRRGLANALRSAEKRWWRDDQVRGLLSPRTLYRLCTDRARLDVFRVRSMMEGRATAVGIVLDGSGSMSSRKMEVARDALRVLLEALGDLKIATEAITFTTGDAFSLQQACQISGQNSHQLQERFSRFGNLEIGLIKQFAEPVRTALQRLPTIRGTGLTPLGEAMQIGASRISQRPESRRILLVLTDGKAGCEGSGDSSTLHAQEIARRITRMGIELVGVGIQDDSLCTIVADTIVIQQIEELPARLCKLLGRTLQKGVCHVG